MPTPVDLREAFALLDSCPLKLGEDNRPHTASFVDDNPDSPVQICDSKGHQLIIMHVDDYDAIMKWDPEVEVTPREE